MDPSYQQAMIQALMGAGSAAPGTGGQNATTPYGQGFMTGNMMVPNGSAYGGQAAQANASNMGANMNGGTNTGMNSSSNLTTGPSTQLQQPMSSY